MEAKRYLIILFSILIMQTKMVLNDTILKLSNLECKSLDVNFFNFKQCKIKAVRPGLTEVTAEVSLLRKPINNATLQANVRKRGVKIGKALLEYNIDCCAFMSNKRRNIFAELVYQLAGFEKWSNMNHTCPYDHDLLLKKYPIDGVKLGKLVPLPVGHYTLNSSCLMKMCVEVGALFSRNYERRKIRISQGILLSLLLIILLQTKVVQNEKIVKLTNIVCKTIDAKYITMKQCKLKAYRPEVTQVTVEVALLQVVVDNVTLKGILRKRGVETGRPLVEFTIDFCAFLRNKRRNLWAEIMYQMMGLQKWSNLNHTCPFGHDLFVDAYQFDGRKMGKFIPFPGGHYTFNTYWYTFDVLRTIFTIHFQLYDK